MTQLLHGFLDRRADRTPDLPAVTVADEHRTYGEVREASLRLAAWLRRAGIARGGIVLIALPPSVLVPPLLYATSRAGAAFCIVHEQVSGPALEHVLDDAEPDLVVTDDAGSADLAAQRGIRVADPAEVAAAAAGAPAPDLPPPLSVDPACLIYTSGSTSRPKAVVCTHRQMTFAARVIQGELRYRRDDVVYAPLSLAFDYGLYQLFLGALSGAHVWLGSATSAGPALLNNLIRSGATVLPAMPTMAQSLAWLLCRGAGESPALRLLTATGAAMPRETLGALRAAMPDLRVQLMYGLTECKRVSIMPVDEDLTRPGAVGRPLPDTEVSVVDDKGRRLPPGEIGEFVVRGPHVMAGYWRRDELTRETFPYTDGLFPELRTGDHGWLDADGYLHVDGRRDDVYKEGSVRVSATEIEAAAYGVDGVRLAAVVPPDDTADRPDAVLFVTGDLTDEQLIDGLRQRIEPMKIPRRCVVVEPMPLNHNGKIDKTALATRTV